MQDILFRPPEDKPFWNSKFGYSIRLGVLSLAIAIVIGLPAGILAALKQNSIIDYISLFIATSGITDPQLCVGHLYDHHLCRVAAPDPGRAQRLGRYSLLDHAGDRAGLWHAGFTARLTRSSMLEVMRQDYVRTARAKGLGERTVVLLHMLKNALIPVITILGPSLVNLVTGSFIIETMFAFPGSGRQYVQAIGQRDYSMIMATTLIYAILIQLANLSVDFMYTLVDPRIKLELNAGKEGDNMSTVAAKRSAEQAYFEHAARQPVAGCLVSFDPQQDGRGGHGHRRLSFSWWRLLRRGIAPHDPLQIYDGKTFLPPPWAPKWMVSTAKVGEPSFFLGTDSIGRDVLSRVMYGARVSVIVGFVPTTIVVIIGMLVGLAAGYAGGRLDNLLMRLTDVVWSFPDLLFFIIVMVSLRDSPMGNLWNGLFLLFGALADRRLGGHRPAGARPGALAQGKRVYRGGALDRRVELAASCSATSCPTASAPSSSRRPSASPA